MKRFKILLAVSAIAFSAQASATVINGSSLQNRLNDISYATSDETVDADFFDVQTSQVGDDSAWELTATAASMNRLMFELAGYKNANTFGIYDIQDASNRLEIFSGSASAGAVSGIYESVGNVFTIMGTATSATFSSRTFGYYLQGPGGTFFSQSFLNVDGADQMVAFQGDDNLYVDASGLGAGLFTGGEFILAWEDLVASGGDRDYNDFVVMVESVTPVPVPGTLALLGLGLLGLGRASRRKARA